ncbi:hypothetical protein ACFYVK_35515 [Streptomyces chartreusis]|uniref:hypothetical protein n=1 Tax=Streptomyces chartreusis TaxID=1969 RepID=UPI0036A0E74E
MAATRKTTTSSTSRKPRSGARAASRPATTRRAAEPDVEEAEVSAAEAQEIEVDGYVTATLCGEDLRIMPPSAWRASWATYLGRGQVAAFVELTVHPDDLELFWEIDPTNAEFGEFIDDATQQDGESPGNSRGPATSPRRTRRR